jgi:peptidoglycan biosynthesis protein MviN/MurJ (putative lipid II flippase)
VAGIAAATVAAGAVAAGVTLVGLHRRHRAVPPLGRLAAGLALAAGVGAAAGWLARLAVEALPGAGSSDGPLGAALVCAAVGVAVLAGYLPVLRLTCPEQFRLLATLPADLRRRR